jgi:hypothetical protein
MSWFSELIERRRGSVAGLVAVAATAILALGGVAAAAIVALGGVAATPVTASASAAVVTAANANYTFQTLDNPADPTFNQLLGINQFGLISGYFGSGMTGFGSGMTGNPNKGYLLPRDGKGGYVSENFPGSVQTQVTGLNDNGLTVGFWADSKGANSGFYRTPIGQFRTADYPAASPANPSVDQLLGVNDQEIAVGFYNDAAGHSHGYSYSLLTHRYMPINVRGASSVTVAAINNRGDVAGFETNSAGHADGFLKLNNGFLITLDVPGASMTQALGVNDGDVVVGAYQVGHGRTAGTHGFIWAPEFGFQTVNEPNGIGGTTVNGINNHGRLVGFYVDSSGNTDGFLATPKSL